MSQYISEKIGQNIVLISAKADRFKTNEISISLLSPLDKTSVSDNALLSSILTHGSAKYKKMTELNKELAFLYGATINGSVSKIGENQVVKLGLTCIDDRFAFDDEKISVKGLSLLLSLLFEPKVTDGAFDSNDIETEKRILKEQIEAENNEKRIYSLRRTEEIMFADEPYGINRYGTVESVDAITPTSAYTALKTLIKKAKIMITVVGNINTATASNMILDKFKNVEREPYTDYKSIIKSDVDKVKDVSERIDVKQGKLVIGFRAGLEPSDDMTAAMRTFCDIFGGGPYSKLFMNVREKLSLCYYCSARYTRLKGSIIVQCGCEEENMDKAVNEINAQLAHIISGDFDDELKSSKMALSDAIMSVYDSPEALENWYCNQMNDDRMLTPDECVKENERVTKEDVIKCASMIKLDTIFRLKSTKEEE